MPLMQIRKIFLIILLNYSHTTWAASGSHAPVTAQAESTPPSYSFNAIYPHLMLPITGAVRGAMLGHTHGHKAAFIAGGVLLGVLDEVMLYSGLTNSLFFTAAFIGGTLPVLGQLGGNFGRIAGSLLGVAYAQGHLSTIEDYVGEPAWGSALGYQAYGTTGAFIGAGAGVIDHGLMALNYTKKPHLSQTFKKALLTKFLVGPWMPSGLAQMSKVPLLGSITNAAATLPYMEFAIPSLMTAYSIAKQENSTQTEEPVLTLKNLKEQMIDLYHDDPSIQINMQRVAAAYITMDQAIYVGVVALLEKISVIRQAVESLNTGAQDTALASFMTGFQDFLLLNLFCASSGFALSAVQTPLHILLTSQLSDQFHNSLLLDENLIGLSGEEDAKTPLKKFNSDIQKLRSHTELLKEGTSKMLTGFDAFSSLIKKNALDIAFTVKAYNDLKTAITAYLAEIDYQYSKELRELESDMSELTAALIADAEGMYLSQTKDLVEEKLQSKRQLALDLEKKQYKISHISHAWDRITGWFGWIYTMKLAVQSISEGKLSYANYFPVVVVANDFLDAQEWGNRNSGRISDSIQGIESLKTIKKSLQKVENKSHQNLIREVVKSDGEFRMILDPVRIGIGDDIKIETSETMTFEPEWYAFTGESGSGKSTILKKIFGLTKDAVWAQGKVTFETFDGEEPSTIMITQSDVIAPGITLLEYLCNCSLDNASSERLEALHARVMPVLQALRFTDSFSEMDHQKERTYLMQKIGQGEGKLAPSGGQKKKMAIARVLLQKVVSKLVILDEIFVGLDPQILAAAQILLKEKLIGSIVIVVDHQARANNLDGVFYDKRIHLMKKNLHIGQVDEFP